MDSNPPTLAGCNTPTLAGRNPPIAPSKRNSTSVNNRDFLTHLEAYLAKRDGVDKLLKVSRYAAKLALTSAALDGSPIAAARLRSFESSVGVSRKAFRLGKFIQDINALRAADPHRNFALSVVAYGGEGLYYFIEQFVWLGKAGLIDKRRLPALQTFSAWCEFIGYFGSISLKMIELKKFDGDLKCLASTIELAVLRGIDYGDEQKKLNNLKTKKTMKRLAVVQDLADALMALADIRDGRGPFSAPVFVSAAGLLSAVISTHKNWISC